MPPIPPKAVPINGPPGTQQGHNNAMQCPSPHPYPEVTTIRTLLTLAINRYHQQTNMPLDDVQVVPGLSIVHSLLVIIVRPWPCFKACCLWSSSACLSSHWSYSTMSLGNRNFLMSKATSRNLAAWQCCGLDKSAVWIKRTRLPKQMQLPMLLCRFWQVPQLYHKKHTKYLAPSAETKLNALVGVEVIPEFVAGQGPKD